MESISTDDDRQVRGAFGASQGSVRTNYRISNLVRMALKFPSIECWPASQPPVAPLSDEISLKISHNGGGAGGLPFVNYERGRRLFNKPGGHTILVNLRDVHTYMGNGCDFLLVNDAAFCTIDCELCAATVMAAFVCWGGIKEAIVGVGRTRA